MSVTYTLCRYSQRYCLLRLWFAIYVLLVAYFFSVQYFLCMFFKGTNNSGAQCTCKFRPADMEYQKRLLAESEYQIDTCRPQDQTIYVSEL